jgi:hypothetical protein
VRPIPVGIRRSVQYVFVYFLRAAEGELQLLLPSRNVRTKYCIVGRKVADEVVKRSFQKRGTIREHQEIGLLGIPCPTDADRSDSVLPFLKTPIELIVGATNYLNNLQVWLRRSSPP